MSAAPGPSSRSADANLSYTAASQVGMADDRVVWAVDGVGIYVTTDQGQSWRTITPPIFKGQSVYGRIDAMVGVGTQDLWIPVVDVIGLFPPTGAASDRFNGIEHSTDGGQSWTFSALPGCLQACGADISLSFLDANRGYAVEGDLNGRASVFSTDDGGATWARVGGFPNLGASDGTSQLTFGNALDGWAVTGPTFGTRDGRYDQVTSAGGALYRTGDGGVTWSLAPGLPPNDQYQLPVLIGDQRAVLIGRPAGGGRAGQPVVFSTDNSGATWTAHQTPRDQAIGSWSLNGAPIPFAATGLADWRLFVGSVLFATTNAGSTWSWVIPQPTWTPTNVNSMVFTSPRLGWLVATRPGCRVPPPGIGTQPDDCYPVLAATTDGGRHWAPQTP